MAEGYLRLQEPKRYYDVHAGDLVEISYNYNSFHGICISNRKNGTQRIIIRNYLHKECIEKEFFLTSPNLQFIKVVKIPYKAYKKSKLYYLRRRGEKYSKVILEELR